MVKEGRFTAKGRKTVATTGAGTAAAGIAGRSPAAA